MNLKNEPTALRGVLWSARGPWLTLVEASLLKGGADPIRVDGEVVLHRTAVLFIQVMP